MIIETILGAVVPLATNLIGGIFSTKEKKIENEKAKTEADIKLLEIKSQIHKAEMEFEIERQRTISATSKTGNAFVDAANGGVRVIIGLSGAFIILSSVIGYFCGYERLLSNEDLSSCVAFILGYYFSEKSCKKSFSWWND